MPDIVRRIHAGYSRRRYAILFFSLLLTLCVAPILTSLGLDLELLQLFLAANVIAAVGAFRPGTARRTLLAVVVIAWSLRIAGTRFDSSTLELAAGAVPILVALQAAAMALRHSLRADAIESEHVFAALGAYLLFGVFFGELFWVVHTLDPSALSLAGVPPDEFTVPDGIYFSFVTLATLGYGDISPRSEVARGLAVFEAIGGQLYLAVMVARLVSLYRTTGRS